MNGTPSFHVYLQFKIAEHSRLKYFRRDELLHLMRFFKIPGEIRERMVEEMILDELLEDNGIRLRVINCDFDEGLFAVSKITRRKIFEKKILNA